MAMIMEQAGAAATNGVSDILDLQPEDHHQRVWLVLGARSEVKLLTQADRT